MDIFVVFIFGLAVGSFLLVLIDRLPKNEPVIVGRSKCDYCHHVLSWYDLIPLFSYVSILGRCRYCKRKLSLKYPVMELLTACVFVVLYLLVFKGWVLYPVSISSPFLLFLFLAVVVSTLYVIFFTDLFYGIIPTGVVIVGVIVTFLYLGVTDITLLLMHLLVGVITMLFFLAIYLVTKQKGIGFGDVIYGFYMGLLLGFPYILVGLYTAFLTGAGVSIILVMLKKKKLRGDSIPFGPFLIFGTILSFILGDIIWNIASTYIGL